MMSSVVQIHHAFGNHENVRQSSISDESSVYSLVCDTIDMAFVDSRHHGTGSSWRTVPVKIAATV